MPLDTFICGACQDAFTDFNEFVNHKQGACPAQQNTPSTGMVSQGSEVIQLHMNESGEITRLSSEPLPDGDESLSNNGAALAFLNDVNMEAELNNAVLEGVGQAADSSRTLIILNNVKGELDNREAGADLLEATQNEGVPEMTSDGSQIAVSENSSTQLNSSSTTTIVMSELGNIMKQDQQPQGGSTNQDGNKVAEPVPKKRRVGRSKKGEGKIKEIEAVPPTTAKPSMPETNADGKLVCTQCKRTFTKERHFNTHKCLASSSYLDITKKEMVKIDSGDEDDEGGNLELDAGAHEDDGEDFSAQVDGDMKEEEEEDEKEMDKEAVDDISDSGDVKRKRGRKRKQPNFRMNLSQAPESEAAEMKAAAESVENLPIFVDDEEKAAFETCVDVDLSQVDNMFRVHIIEQELNEMSGMVYNTPTMSSLSVYSCNVCEKVFKSLSHIRLHCVIHTDLKPFKCSKCSYSTNSKGNLYTHMRKHTGQFYRCDQCDFKTVNKTHLIEHQMTHDSRRPQCVMCQKDYSTIKSLINHVRKYHTNQQGKEYLATFLQGRGAKGTTIIHQCHVCNRKFKKRIDRDRHLFIHDIKDLPNVQQCELCDYWASRRVYLEKHYLKHRVIYCCAVCDQKFLSTTRLTEHINAEHSNYGENGTIDDSLLAECINRSLYLPEPLAPSREGSKYVNLPEELRASSSEQQNPSGESLEVDVPSGNEERDPTESSVTPSGSEENLAPPISVEDNTNGFLSEYSQFINPPASSGSGPMSLIDQPLMSEDKTSAPGDGSDSQAVVESDLGAGESMDGQNLIDTGQGLEGGGRQVTSGEDLKCDDEKAQDREEEENQPDQEKGFDESSDKSPEISNNDLHSLNPTADLRDLPSSEMEPPPPMFMLPNPGSDSDEHTNPGDGDGEDGEQAGNDGMVSVESRDVLKMGVQEGDAENAEVEGVEEGDKEVAEEDSSSIPSKQDSIEIVGAKTDNLTKEDKISSLIKRMGYCQMTMDIFNKMRETFGTEECEFCGRLFYNKADYEPHLRTHTGDKPFACSNCSFRAITKDQLKRHSEKEHEKVAFQCKECDFLAPTRTRLWNHQLKHLGISGLSCPQCPTKFDGMKQLRAHILNTHKDVDRETLEKLTGYRHKPQGKMGRRSFKCPHCPRMFIRANSELQKHIWIHEGIKPFACPICPYACRSKNNLQAHMLRHSAEKPFSCSECKKEYKSKTALRWHVRSHKTGKLFKCEKCPYEATQSSHLKRHMETHDVLKRFICKHCDFSANTLGYMKIHYAKHHKGQAFVHDEFVETNTAVSEKRVYKCLSCGYLFGNMSDLKRHLKIRHHVQMQAINGMEQMQISEVEVVQYSGDVSMVGAAAASGMPEVQQIQQPVQISTGELQIPSQGEGGDGRVSTANLIQQLIGMSQGDSQVRVVTEDGEPLEISPETIIVQQDGQLLMTTDTSSIVPSNQQYIIQYYNPGEVPPGGVEGMEDTDTSAHLVNTVETPDQNLIITSDPEVQGQANQLIITADGQAQLVTSEGPNQILSTEGQILSSESQTSNQLIVQRDEHSQMSSTGGQTYIINPDISGGQFITLQDETQQNGTLESNHADNGQFVTSELESYSNQLIISDPNASDEPLTSGVSIDGQDS